MPTKKSQRNRPGCTLLKCATVGFLKPHAPLKEANLFIVGLLGCQHDVLLGKELWEIGLLKDEPKRIAAFSEWPANPTGD